MKKLLAILICAILMIMPMAFAENGVRLTADVMGETYSGVYGVTEDGSTVISVDDIAGIGAIALQLTGDTLYLKADMLGLTVSVTENDIASLMSMANVNDNSAANMEALMAFAGPITELANAIGEQCASLVKLTETGFDCSFTFREMWALCGETLITWAENNADAIDALAAATEQTNFSAEALIQALKQIDANPGMIDFEFICKGDFATMSATIGAKSSGVEVFNVDIAMTDASTVEINVSQQGQQVAAIVITVTESALAVSVNGTELVVISWEPADVACFTDGSDAMPLSDLLTLLQSMASASSLK